MTYFIQYFDNLYDRWRPETDAALQYETAASAWAWIIDRHGPIETIRSNFRVLDEWGESIPVVAAGAPADEWEVSLIPEARPVDWLDPEAALASVRSLQESAEQMYARISEQNAVHDAEPVFVPHSWFDSTPIMGVEQLHRDPLQEQMTLAIAKFMYHTAFLATDLHPRNCISFYSRIRFYERACRPLMATVRGMRAYHITPYDLDIRVGLCLTDTMGFEVQSWDRWVREVYRDAERIGRSEYRNY